MKPNSDRREAQSKPTATKHIRSLMKDHVCDLSKCAYSGCKQPLLSVVLPSRLYQGQLLEVKNGCYIGNSHNSDIDLRIDPVLSPV